MTRSFKMVLLDALLELDGLGPDGVSLESLAARSWDVLSRSPELAAEVPDDSRPDGTPSGETRWRAYWRGNPVDAWTGAKRASAAVFRLVGDRMVLREDVDEADRPTLADLLRELVDYRLTRYRRRLDTPDAQREAFLCKVLRNERDPILKLPSRGRVPVPDGERDVRLPDGSVWRFRFAKEFVNVARPAGTDRNQLPDLLRGWFGPSVGTAGTSYQVRFAPSPDGLWIEPVSAQVLAFPERRNVVAAYPDLRAAAGNAGTGQESLDRDEVALPVDVATDALFAVRVAGDSMDGGSAPLRNGDWAVLRLARGAPPPSMESKVVLVETSGDGAGSQFQLKRLIRHDGRWHLASDNLTGPTFDARDDMTVIARLERSFSPESLAPAVGTTITEVDLARAFGLGELSASTGRHGGHLFAFVDQKGVLVSPDAVSLPAIGARPGETAFVLARRDPTTWRYLGVGRRYEDLREASFEIPEVDYETWRAWGDGRAVSRPLPDDALSAAQRIVDVLVALPEGEQVLDRDDGRRAFVRGVAPRGGLRIDGGPGGFEARTVSLTDLAWVAVAAKDVEANGGVFDEARVNRARYLEGTAKGSTRWIDTGWALAAWRAVGGRAGALGEEPGALRRVRDDDGKELDASYRIERIGNAATIIYESRGGTRGGADERNTEYNPGLEVLLGRLGRAGAVITDALVESETTKGLPDDARRLVIEGETYPIRINDAATLRKKLGSAQAKVGRAEGAKGPGNATKRVRLMIARDGAPATEGELAKWLEADSPIESS